MSQSLDENLRDKTWTEWFILVTVTYVDDVFLSLFFVIIIFSPLKLAVTSHMAFFLSFFSDVFINATGRLSLFLE